MAITNVFRENVQHPLYNTEGYTGNRWITMRDVVDGVLKQDSNPEWRTVTLSGNQDSCNVTDIVILPTDGSTTVSFTITIAQTYNSDEYRFGSDEVCKIQENSENLTNIFISGIEMTKISSSSSFPIELIQNDEEYKYEITWKVAVRANTVIPSTITQKDIKFDYTINVKEYGFTLSSKRVIRYYDGENNLLNVGSIWAPMYAQQGEFKSIDVNLDDLNLFDGTVGNKNNIDTKIQVTPDAINLTINDTVLSELKEIAFSTSNTDSNTLRIIEEEGENNG